MNDQANEKSIPSSYTDVFAHLDQCKRILEEWEQEEQKAQEQRVYAMVLEAAKRNAE